MKITEITAERKQKTECIRLAAYCRVSSDSADQLHSFAAQIRYYKDYEKKHPQYKLVDIYADEGLSGTDMKKRDEQNRLIRDCKKGKIDRIIVKSVSRFARNTQELLITLRILKEIGVSVYFEEQGIDTDKINMEMIVTFPGMAAQQESEAISGNLRWSYRKRMESGEFNCCYPAYGFRLFEGKLEIHETEAAVIRRIFELYLQGMGMQRIANLLNEECIPRRKEAQKWHFSTIKYILNNERYMGDAVLQKSYTTETLPFRRRVNNGELPMFYVENSNPPIISREIYRAAQALQKERTVQRSGQYAVYPLSKILRCPDCGRSFRRQITAGKAYWLCSGRAAGATQCKSRRVQEIAVYEAFCQMVCKLKAYREQILAPLIHQMEVIQNQSNPLQEKIREIDKKIADLSAQNLVVARLHTKGILSAADFSAQADELGGKIRELRSERHKLLTEDETDEQIDALRNLNEKIQEYEPSGSFEAELFEQIVESVVVDSNAALTFKLVGGVELTEEIPMKGRCKSR